MVVSRFWPFGAISVFRMRVVWMRDFSAERSRVDHLEENKVVAICLRFSWHAYNGRLHVDPFVLL